ncbi:tbc1 domain family member 5 [Phtheirospermum japonicum]|uniref:Tbc1 domain family member 5 n=1 Tax=Phtheirospermum japonicum TaxID=374723 RepID=A0A830DEG3_9LAMI|nr:tbc1 domain family member 5 [Phtheirospermum japonicum]
MSSVPLEKAMPETASCSVGSRRFGDLRGVQWRVDLGILPSSPSASIDDLRRVTANSRRSYASLRKQLLVDPHLPKDGGCSPDLVMDNPLSQDPDSMWGRFFRNAELERMVDQDLTRLYPERGSYFQTSGCQGMLRRILLLWCLRHPECGYRQGMHELLAPLLYVLHVDVERLSEVRKAHEDHFADKFDGFSYHENNSTYKFDFKKLLEASGDDNEFEKKHSKASSLAELDLVTQTIVLLSDAYGAEGELGTVLSEKFTEHDAYSMFDTLMSGARGIVAMSDFFSPSPYSSSHSGFAPVIEASAAMYHLLSIVDSSLHSHLIELGVEPQYFSLRWLRVLFGREFSLENLLVIWDETFACDNENPNKAREAESYFRVLDSPRGAFISAFAVSMILELRSSLLATENATVCLQRLLNFPNNVSLVKLISKAKSLQALAMNLSYSNPGLFNPDGKKPVIISRGHHTHTLSLDSASSPGAPLKESYWEEKWRVLNDEEEKLCRSESDPSSLKKTEIQETSVRRSLLEDLARQLQDDNKKNAGCNNNNNNNNNIGDFKENERQDLFEVNGQDVREEIFRDFSEPNSPIINGNIINNNISDEGDGSESSSVASNSSIDEYYDAKKRGVTSKCTENDESVRKSGTGQVKERKGKFQWLWKLGRNASEGTTTSVRPIASDGDESGRVNGDGCDSSSETSKGEIVDQDLMGSLRNLGQSMMENIQVIESVLQENHGQVGPPESLSKNGGFGRGQVIAMSALEELRKISRILSEM